MRYEKENIIKPNYIISTAWTPSKIKYVADFEPRYDFSNISSNTIITYTPMECVKNGWYEQKTAEYGNLDKTLTPFIDGDIVLAKVTPCFENGNIAIMNNIEAGIGLGSSELFVLHAQGINSQYLFYWLQNEDFKQKACATMTGAGGLKRVSSYFIKNCEILLPSATEQMRIANFLSSECSDIQMIIDKTHASIDSYQKLKKSIIYNAVTKGIDDYQLMKDSGIEWIGKMPDDWNLMRLQWCLQEINDHNSPIQTTTILSLTNKLGILPYEEKGNQGNKSKEDITGYKIAYENTLIVNSMNVIIGSVGISKYYGCVSPVYYVFKETEIADLRWINYIFQTTQFQKELRRYANGIMEIRLRISIDNLLKQIIPLPPIAIQSKIIDYLDRHCAEIDTLIAKKEQFITELESYKKSLIYEYVTGKKEVPA